MNKQEANKLVTEISELKRTLQQKEQKIATIKEKVNGLNRQNKAITNKLARSKKRGNELKSTLQEEQKKTYCV